MCLVLGRRGLGWSRPTFMGRSRPISCLDEWVGADPVFCLVEEVERVLDGCPFNTVSSGPHLSAAGPTSQPLLFFSSLPLLPPSSSPHGSSPGSSRRPLLSLRPGLPPQFLPDAVPPPAPPDAGRCLPDSSPALPPRLLPGRSLPPSSPHRARPLLPRSDARVQRTDAMSVDAGRCNVRRGLRARGLSRVGGRGP